MKRCLFLGDSLIEFGDWQALLTDLHITNRGIAGETVQELAARLSSEIYTNGEPDHLLMMCGTNNLLMGDDTFPAIFKTMLQVAAQQCPETSITVNSLFPMDKTIVDWLPGGNVTEVNCVLKEVSLEEGAHFFDVYSLFMEKCGTGKENCFEADGVHLSHFGYRIWSKGLNAHFRRSVG